ncbi:MAG: hypothetical protein AAGJ73_10555 [Pseudomonadota bacterium]
MNKALALALIAAATLSACESSERAKAARERNPAPCPNVLVLSDAARAIDFAGDAKALEDVAYTAEVTDVSLACRYFADEPIDASIEIDFAFGRGPKGVEGEKEFTYFVAVTRRNLEVIEKAEYTIPVKFGGRDNVETVTQKIDEIIIPRASEKTAGTNFEVIVGLSLTPDQARFNRSGASLKFPEL